MEEQNVWFTHRLNKTVIRKNITRMITYRMRRKNLSQNEFQMSENPCYFIGEHHNNRDSKMSNFQPTGSKNCGVSLPPYVVKHLDSIRGGYPRSKFVLALIKKSLELKEPTGVKIIES